MESTRRKFILGTGAALVGSTLERVGADIIPTTSAPDIRQMLQTSGYDPGNPNSALMAVVADLHINQNPTHPKFTDHFDDRLVAEVNGLTPAITDLAIAGDLIVYLSDVIGGGRYPHGYAWALQEFQIAKAQMTRFRPDMRLYAVPGNHDTDRFEEDAETWRTQLEIPPYQKKVLGGVPVFFLNSGHAGMLNPAQAQWFKNEAASIPADQEVLIIAHHPVFFHLFPEAGLKRSAATVFRKHRAPVWIVGGHGHAFGEALFVSHHGARFIQMEVTNGNPILWGDGKTPGYILLALQDGRVIHRSFRSLTATTFQIRKPHNELQATALRFPFDAIEYPAAVFEEGFYQRSGRLTEVVGIDLKSHFIQCRNYTVRVDLETARGKVSDFLLSAEIPHSIASPSCHFSATGLDNSWIEAPFPTPNYQQVYRVPIPSTLRSSASLHVRVKSQLQGPYDGILVCGWGLAADPSKLTEFEKWLSLHYRTLLAGAESLPTARPSGSSLTNLEHFAFNIALPAGVSQSPQTAIAQPGTPISAQPAYSQTFRNVMNYRFARRRAATTPAVSYAVEHSSDMIQWTTVEEDLLAITSLDEEWEEVCLNLPLTEGSRGFCRARVTAIPAGDGGGIHIAPGDLDGDGIDDLMQYAFDIRIENGRPLPYDPDRPANKPGVPILKQHSVRMSRLAFPKMQASAIPGVAYRIEWSADLTEWTNVPSSLMTERVIRSNDDWNEVEILVMDTALHQMFYRVALETTTPTTP